MFFKKKTPSDTSELVPEQGFGLFTAKRSPAATPAPLKRGTIAASADADIVDVVEVREVSGASWSPPSPPPLAPESLVIDVLPEPEPEPMARVSDMPVIADMPEVVPVPAKAPGAFANMSTKRAVAEPVQPQSPLAADPVPEAAQASAKPPGNAWGTSFFKSLKKDTPPGAMPSAAPPPAQSKPPRKEVPTGKAKLKVNPAASKQVRAAKAGAGLTVLVELEGGREVYWDITETGMTETNAAQTARALSFTRGDLRFSAPTALSRSAARDLALAETGEPVRVLNASKALQAVYATPVARVAALAPVVVGPGLLVLEHLLKSQREPGEPLLCGLVLKDAASGMSLVVLYFFSSTDEVSAVQVTVNADNTNFVVSQFAATHRLDLETTKAVLLTNLDLIQGLATAQYHSVDGQFMGVSLKKISQRLPVVMALAAAGLGSYASYAYTQVAMTERTLATLQDQKKTLQSELDAALLSSVRAFAQTQTVDVRRVTARAESFWVPSSKLALMATPAVETYILTRPIVQQGQVIDRPTVMGQVSAQDLAPLWAAGAVEGCTKTPPALTGSLNALQLKITCESGPSSLSGYWPQ